MLIEGGIDVAHNQEYPLSGLKGNLWRLPTIGISVGISSIAELQIDGGPYDVLTITERRPAPLADLLTATGTSTHDVDDIVIGTKIRLLAETASRPAFGFRFATRAAERVEREWASGSTRPTSTRRFSAPRPCSPMRVVGNLGVRHPERSDSTATEQNDVLTVRRCRSRGR